MHQCFSGVPRPVYARHPHRITTIFACTRRPPLCHCWRISSPATISFAKSYPETCGSSAAERSVLSGLWRLGSTLSVYPGASFPLMRLDEGSPMSSSTGGRTIDIKIRPCHCDSTRSGIDLPAGSRAIAGILHRHPDRERRDDVPEIIHHELSFVSCLGPFHSSLGRE